MKGWLVFLYRLPPEPSAPRVATWRALKRLRGVLLQKGVYVAPRDALHEEALRSLAHDVRNWAGEASVLEVAKVDDEALLRKRIRDAAQ